MTEPLPPPGPQDWLAHHPEPGQTFEDFAASKPNRPDGVRRRIYLQPLGEFSSGIAPSIDLLREFAEAFFVMDVALLPSLGEERITSRRNPYSGQPQLLTTDILSMLQRALPTDSFCVIAITMRDLYPQPSWNFVFGQASLRERTGVFSFARYDPRFYGVPDENRDVLMLRRSCKVLAHEIAHMFGIEHCVFFRCLMNGSNHLAESDARPLHVCPVDFRKLHFSVGFDALQRYRELQAISQKFGFDDESDWIVQQLRELQHE